MDYFGSRYEAIDRKQYVFREEEPSADTELDFEDNGDYEEELDMMELGL